MMILRNFFFAGFFLSFSLFAVGGALVAATTMSNLGAWSYWRVLPAALLLSAGGGAIGVLMALIVPLGTRRVLLAGLRGLTVIVFAVTVFLPQGVALLDGNGVSASNRFVFFIWFGYLALLALLVFLGLRRELILNKFFNLSAVLGASIVICVGTYFGYSEDEIENLRSSEAPISDLYQFGTKRNVVVILMDMLQGSFVEQALKDDPVMAERYKDFTFYTRAISTFPMTNYSVPSILSGKVYSSERDRRFVFNLPAAISDSFISDAEALGFGVAAVQAVPFIPIANRNIAGFKMSIDRGASEGLYKKYILEEYSLELAYVSLLRFVKLDFRESIGLGNQMADLKKDGEFLLKEWAHQSHLGDQEKKIFFVHNFLTHSPIVYSRNGQSYSDLSKYSWTPGNLLEEISYSFSLMGGVFNKMKDLGVFDDSLILIIGDHGHFMGYQKEGAYSGVEDFEGYVSGENFRPAAMYNPAIVIKQPRSQGGGVSHDVIGLVDIRGILKSYLDNGWVDLEGYLKSRRNAEPHLPVMTCVKEINPYFSDDCHTIVPVDGNVASVPKLFESLVRN